MTYDEFLESMNNIKAFQKELDSLDDVLRVISPSGTCVCEIGHRFIDNYISLVSKNLGDKEEWVSWFIFENQYGARKFTTEFNGIEYVISDERTFYDFLKLL